MDMTKQVQIIHEAVCISYVPHTFGKFMHSIIFPSAMGK